jgi:6-phosphogluconolactonase
MRFYVGTYSQRGSKGIYVFDLEPTTGATTLVGTADSVKNPSFVAVSRDGKFLYAVSEKSDGPDKSGSVAALALPASGVPVLLNQQLSHGADPCHISVDHQRKHALVANYSSGTVAVLPIAADGRLLAAKTVIQDRSASRVNPGRQEAPHAHSINLDPAGRFVTVADLGCDRLFVYKYDSERGTLTPNDPPAVTTHPGAGPRHLAFSSDARQAYGINELDSTIVVYGYDARRGTFAEKQRISTLPTGWKGQNTTAEVCVHPSGKFVYGTNRGHDSVAAFSVDKATGGLREIDLFPTNGKTPRGMAIDPTGAFLITGNQDSDSLSVFRINAADGRLALTGNVVVPAAVCVVFG